MTPFDEQLAPHMTRFLHMLDAAFRRYGVPDGLPPRFREAVAATPRHCFVHRFRVSRFRVGGDPLRDSFRASDGPLRDNDANQAEDWATIYSDAVMRHVDAAGEPLPSSNSQPSYVLFLLHLLGLEQGQAVLEIGSGSGWLAAVMARLVGPGGRVTGVELIPDLAAQSRTDLAALGLNNVQIITGDGTQGHAGTAPYNRAMVTAATWEVPAALRDQVAENGRILVPIELRSGDGCDVTVFRRQGAALVAERAIPCWFVPLLGVGQERLRARPDPLLLGKPVARHALPLGMPGGGGPAPAAALFRAFLGRTEPGFVTIPSNADEEWRPELPVPPFGVVEADGSVALWQAGEIVSYGSRMAATRLARAYALWAELGLPGMAAFQLEIYNSDAAPAATDRLWVERRGETALAWHLETNLGTWQTLAQAEDGVDGSSRKGG